MLVALWGNGCELKGVVQDLMIPWLQLKTLYHVMM